MLTLEKVKNNPYILEFIRQTEIALAVSGFTDHGLNHANFVSQRAFKIAQKIKLSKRDQELAAIAGFCHDMGNFLSRTYHHYLGALLFFQVFFQEDPRQVSQICQAIANHDKEELKFSNPISAVLVLADKSDVRRSRVITKKLEHIKTDIHERVNYGTKTSELRIDFKRKKIILSLKIDTKFVPIMEYFEIFTQRMVYCRKAANFLGYQFSLIINNFKLL